MNDLTIPLKKAYLIEELRIIEGVAFEIETSHFFKGSATRKFFKESILDEFWIISSAGLTVNNITFHKQYAKEVVKSRREALKEVEEIRESTHRISKKYAKKKKSGKKK